MRKRLVMPTFFYYKKGNVIHLYLSLTSLKIGVKGQIISTDIKIGVGLNRGE